MKSYEIVKKRETIIKKSDKNYQTFNEINKIKLP